MEKMMTKPTQPIDPDGVFDVLETARQTGVLRDGVSSSDVKYQSSQTYPGKLERINCDGSVEVGQFVDGQFVREPIEL
jgi:hypothetical protein